MPVATTEQYAEMLDKAKAGGYAFPAINENGAMQTMLFTPIGKDS